MWLFDCFLSFFVKRNFVSQLKNLVYTIVHKEKCWKILHIYSGKVLQNWWRCTYEVKVLIVYWISSLFLVTAVQTSIIWGSLARCPKEGCMGLTLLCTFSCLRTNRTYPMFTLLQYRYKIVHYILYFKLFASMSVLDYLNLRRGAGKLFKAWQKLRIWHMFSFPLFSSQGLAAHCSCNSEMLSLPPQSC